ncbi:agmatine/peptidylarginine deiminase [Melioribacteraceae bacterium 4301-Me]|uniref:agmatine deiminase family protein n=1 Tax=Pyranulibacter aquaticus TaxID=3163344 RepID=UPI003597FDF9
MNKTINFRLPAEWEPHKSTIICWPHQKEDWPRKFAPIQWVYCEIIKNITNGELVRIIVQSHSQRTKIVNYLTRAHIDLTNIEFIYAKTDRSWMRDISPIFVKSENETIALKFDFNGWAKYSNCKKDRNIPMVLSNALEIKMIEAKYKNKTIVLEGGAVDSNGCGTLITTEECLLDNDVQPRNPGFTKKDYEKILEKYLGIKNVIWLGKGIAGDDTHGHVDDLCRFVNKNTVVICSEKNPSDENYIPLKENLERLKEAKLEDGSKLNIIEIPMPRPIYFDNLRLPASYANFYITNNAVLVPTFNDPNDRIVLNIFKEMFNDREVIGIHSVDLVWGLGTIHCLSHEEPL